MIEAGLYADNCFLTLTYADNPTSLQPLDHRRFMDALRKRVAPLKIRFYMVGEYGERHQRPHFHYALFGFPTCKGRDRSRKFRCCAPCDLIEDVWGRGFIYNRPLEIGSARYIARYVLKKMTRWDDPRLGNRHPEFARMSLKPGIGAGLVQSIAATITRYKLLTPQGDVPVTLRHGNQEWPLGRYLRKQIRKELGLDQRSPMVLSAENSMEAFLQDSEMLKLRLAARADSENPSLKHHILKASENARLTLAHRHRLFDSKKGTL